MSHPSGRVLSERTDVTNAFNKQLKTPGKKCSPVHLSSTNCSCSNLYNETDGQHSLKHKMKRRKTRRERSQLRGEERISKSKLHHYHHHHHRQSNKDKTKARFHYSCQSSSHTLPRRDAQFAKRFPAAQEPSVITDSRLIGHHGLFNHEVKSIDIERLLSEQRKLERLGEQEKNMAASHPSPASYLPSPCSSSDMVVADINNEDPPTEKKADLATKAHKICREKEKATFQSNSDRSDITPGQRPQHQLDLSSESDNGTFSSTNTPPDVLTNSSKKPDVTEKGGHSQLTPCIGKEGARPQIKKVKAVLNSHNLEHTPKNQEPPPPQIQTCEASPNPLQFFSSPVAGTSDSIDTQHQLDGGLDRISYSVSAMAARLCLCLQFPLQRKRNLVAESREVLLQALRERHGPLLEENLLKVQQRLSFGTGPSKAFRVQDKGSSTMDTKGFWPADIFNTDESYFATEKRASFKRRSKQRHCSWTSPPKPHQSLYQAVEYMTSPSLEKAGDLMDEMLRPSPSSQFCMDFQASGTSSPDRMFPPCPTPRWAVQPSPLQHWDDRFNKATSRESVKLDCFENSCFNLTRVTESSSGPQHSESSHQPFLDYLARPPDGRPTELRHFHQGQDAFDKTDRRSFAPSSSTHDRNQVCHVYHFSRPSTRPSLRSYHTDMMHYPPSYMLESGPSSTLPSFPSPEHWSFPPMRLY